MGTNRGPKYIPYSYMEPLGFLQRLRGNVDIDNVELGKAPPGFRVYGFIRGTWK